ncbi:MAG TPA: tetraacyldisaccharide 4'-kinase [Blastocatellia bacterium]|nr:tetraacyldisaccharide 4'-kinase [Blastocatellia bacterium]
MIGKTSKLTRALLWPPAKLYEMAVRARVAAYETEYLKPARLDATVIGVGNITLGGTGKTPLVEYIARYLKDEGHSVAILTRGYGRRSRGRLVLNRAAAGNSKLGDDAARHPTLGFREFGDEPLMLARNLPDIPIIIDRNRYEAGRWAERELGAEVLILDDGYQHLGLARDINILVLDATDPFGGFAMVPFGRLREPLYAIRRADAVIVTRADRPFDQAQTGAIIKYFCGEQVPVMYAGSSITALRHLATGVGYDAAHFRGWNSAVVCGIGNPTAFSDDLLQIGINIVSESFFGDHHEFTREDLERVTRAARDAGADAIVTTEKDAVRLDGLIQGDVPIYAARLEIESDDQVRLKSLLLRSLTK